MLITDDIRAALKVLDRTKRSKGNCVPLSDVAAIAEVDEQAVLDAAYIAGIKVADGKLAISVESLRVAQRKKERDQKKAERRAMKKSEPQKDFNPWAAGTYYRSGN